MIAFLIRSETQMLTLGRKLGERVELGDLLFLFGDLGAGKTTLTRGIAQGMGIDEPITSPTFQLKKTYCGKLVLNHLDLYRMRSSSELDIIEPDDLLEEGVTVVEWGQLLLERFQRDYLEITIELDAIPDQRQVFFRPHGVRYHNLIEGLKDVDLGN